MKVFVCRICMATDRKMFIFDNNHKSIYENLTGFTVPCKDRLPKYVCWECRHFLSKFFAFKSKAVTSYYIFMEILMSAQDITKTTLIKYQSRPTLRRSENSYILYLDGKDHDDSEEAEVDSKKGIEFKNEAEHIWEVEINDLSGIDDNDELDVKIGVHSKSIDDKSQATNSKTEDKSVQYIYNMEIKDEFRLANVGEYIYNMGFKDEFPLANVGDYESKSMLSNDSVENKSKIIENTVTKIEDDKSGKVMDNIEINDYDQIDIQIGVNAKRIDDTSEVVNLKTDNSKYVGKFEIIGNVPRNNISDNGNKPLLSNDSVENKAIENTIVVIENFESGKNIDNIEITDIKTAYGNKPLLSNNNLENKNKSIKRTLKTLHDDDNVKMNKLIENRKLDKDMFTVTLLSMEEQIAGMKQREESAHYVKSLHKCTKCFKGFIHIDKLNRHMELHSKAMGPFRCDLCQLRFRRRSNLWAHKLIHSLRISCKQCDFVTNAYCRATKHWDFHRGKEYECSHCNAVFTHMTSYLTHLRTQHPSDVICQQCGCSFINALGLRYHTRRLHRFNQLPIPEDGPHCERCDIRFASQDALENHKLWSAKHADERVGKKIVLRRGRKQREEVQGALRRKKRAPITLAKAGGPRPCEQCDEILPDARAYFFHFRTAHKGKNRTIFFPHKFMQRVLCEVCGKMCQSKCHLRYHQHAHADSKQFECDRCGKQFALRAYLLLHWRKHAVRPSVRGRHPCAVCGATLSSRSNQLRHMEIHKGNSYECEICHKVFNCQGNRKNHIDFVHNKKSRPKRNRLPRRQPDAVAQETSSKAVLPEQLDEP